jgi:hypothetical protein
MEVIGTCSKLFKELYETCEKFKGQIGTQKKPTKKQNKSGDSDEEETKTTKKSKKKGKDPLKDDPNAPARPIMQAYLLYFTEVRPARQAQNPTLQNQELTRLIGQEWTGLSKDKKAVAYFLTNMNG